jgi:hypothetical protein
MFNLGANPKVRGAGHILLQTLRPFTIIGLLSLMTSSWVMIVLSGLTGHFSFFDTMTHIFVSAIAACLVVSEVADMFSGLQRYFERNWPVLSPSHSLAWLGMAMVMLGCQVLGCLDKDAFSQNNLGMPLWRFVLASGILALTFGAANIVASIVFRDGNNGITARQIRTDGNLATPPASKADYFDSYSQRDNFSQHSQRSFPSVRQKEEEAPPAGRRITKIFDVRNLRRSKIQISKPILMPAEPDVEQQQPDDDFQNDRASPILPHMQRPPTALHPAYTGRSRYSEAHMSRF